jgi:PAS domain S-box-containing protein
MQANAAITGKLVFATKSDYQVLSQSLSDSLILVDQQGLIVAWNDACEQLTGYPAGEVLNHPVWDIVRLMVPLEDDSPEKLKLSKNKIIKEFRDGKFSSLGKAWEMVIHTRAGYAQRVRHISFPINIENLDYVACLIQTRLPTQPIDHHFLGSTLPLRTIVESSPVGLLTIDNAFRLTYANIEACHILGITQDKVYGRDFTPFVDEEYRAFVVDRYLRRQKGESVPAQYEFNLTLLDGSSRRVEISCAAITDQEGNPVTICLLSDITEQTKAEQRINQRNQELEALAKVTAAMRMAQKRVDIYSTILQQSTDLLKAGGAALVLYEPETDQANLELGYRTWQDWNQGYNQVFKDITAQVIKTGQPFRSDTTWEAAHPATEREVAHVVCVPMIASKHTIGTLWIGRVIPFLDSDLRLLSAISDMAANAIHRQTLHENLEIQHENLRQAQARLLQSEKLAALGQLVSGVAHELSNPLASVVLYSQLAQQEIQDPIVKQNMDKVVSEAMRAGRIVRGLLDFSRQRPINKKSIDINEIVTSSLDLVSYDIKTRNIGLELLLTPNLPRIMADPHQLQQVLINLVQNAWQAMAGSKNAGKLVISTETGKSKYLSPESNGENIIRIQIQDNGSGIAPENLHQIFDPFFTTKAEGEGTGLGLSVCHGIVTEHGGHIWADSNPGKGSTFFVELPIIENKKIPTGKETSSSSAIPQGKGKSVLIIDDESGVKDVLTQALRRQGYKVKAVSSGLDGLTTISQSRFDHIICDLNLPGLNGMDLYKTVQTRDQSHARRIIFITGDGSNKATREFCEKNQIRCLSKPFELSELLQILQD